MHKILWRSRKHFPPNPLQTEESVSTIWEIRWISIVSRDFHSPATWQWGAKLPLLPLLCSFLGKRENPGEAELKARKQSWQDPNVSCDADLQLLPLYYWCSLQTLLLKGSQSGNNSGTLLFGVSIHSVAATLTDPGRWHPLSLEIKVPDAPPAPRLNLH